METYGQALKRMLKNLNWSQKDLSLKTGIPTSAISSYVTNKYLPKDDNDFRIMEEISKVNTIEKVIINPYRLTIIFIFKTGDEIKYNHIWKSPLVGDTFEEIQLDLKLETFFGEVKYVIDSVESSESSPNLIKKMKDNFSDELFASFQAYYLYALTALIKKYYILTYNDRTFEEIFPIQFAVFKQNGGIIGIISINDYNEPKLDNKSSFELTK